MPSRRRLTPGSGDAATVSIVSPGQVLNDHYRLVREIARGGMGIVFEAEDIKLEGRRVAIKILPPEVAKDEGAVLRLKREAASVARLDHANIVRLIEFNATGHCHYLVMEFLDGDNLSVYLARNECVPVDDVLAIARDVLPALAFAHEQGVIHRDIKPANLMFKAVGTMRVTKITDFGIAYQLKDSMSRLTGLESAGTLLYASPEQLRGMKPSAATDQYSLAATLYELLSGEPPFTGAGLSHQILEAKPAPLADVPAHVDDAIRRALAKEPGGRFPDCGAFLEALEGRATVGSPERGSAHRGGAWRFAVVLLSLIAMVVVGWGLGLRGGSRGAPGPVAAATEAPAGGPLPVPVSGRVGETWTNSVGMKFSWCPPGEFDMGSPAGESERYDDEGPVHRVRVARGFWFGTYEVTQGDWLAVMGSNPASFKGVDRRPVEQVSWPDCQEFVEKLAWRDGNDYRLPSEAEWEYAARAGTTEARYGDVDAVAWYDKNSGPTTQPAGGKRANAWGLYDMLGNVWEWCQDTRHDDYTGAPTDGSAWGGGSGSRIIRGGSWCREARLVRAAFRAGLDPVSHYDASGLRVVVLPRTP